ncbi:ATP-grasp domain-containing protein [Pseudoalteromonas phenolica]|uniref:ATP-grasp domain-containing protein n=1 Tax=Pseudoalteromonas phenolica TaxID=161398 RepID=UPI00110A528B|nr:hypothetical protein [Pseudoalteromonas phenolica]TMO54345.1 hypothetical protein CWC21_15515 [Pseudoalteromonas phenolica]
MGKFIVMGQQEDLHTQHMLEQLKLKTDDVYHFQSHDFPSKAQLSLDLISEQGHAITTVCGTKILLNDIEAVYWRNFSGVSDEATKNNVGSIESLSAYDSMATIRTWMQLGNDTQWFNSWAAYQYHQEKPRQLLKVKQLGCNIPKTYIGNELTEIKKAFLTFKKAIFKPVYGGAYTEWLTSGHLVKEHAEAALRKSPITVQEYIPGTNIRTFVIDEKVVSVEVNSESVDFREDNLSSMHCVNTPIHIQSQALAITKALRLKWTAIDWRKSPDGHYYFLEANPSPMFLATEERTELPITKWLVEAMLNSRH